MRLIRYLFGYANYYYRWAIWYIMTAFAHVRVWISKPWWLARFNIAWAEYQSGPVYRERLANLGLAYAIDIFIKSMWERKYCFKLRCRKEQWLRWKLICMPFSFDIPEDLIIASRQGYFKPDNHKKFNII